MLVMLNPEYIMGALVCAKSLKDSATIYPVVCMITEDIISSDLLSILSTVFDDIIIVPIIEHPVKPFETIRQQEMYGYWMDKSFTKWNCLTLSYKDSEGNNKLYDKVILLDVDMVMTTNCDELFSLRAPAGCFSQPWATPYQKHGAIYNPYIKCSKKWVMNKDIPHGATIKNNVIMNALTNKIPTFVVGAFMVLLTPNIEDYNILINDVIKKYDTYGEFIPESEPSKKMISISGSDETSISLLYAQRGIDFTHIHQKFAAAIWKKEWVAPGEERGIHYFGKTKPWNMHVDEYPDLKIWWDIADSLCLENEDIKKIIYPDYEISRLDIAIAEYELAKDIQKLIVQFITPNNGTKINKSALWNLAINMVKNMMIDIEIDIEAIESNYPLWNAALMREYKYEDFSILNISKLMFIKLIQEIKNYITNRIKIKPRNSNIIVLQNEIKCGNHIKINKSLKYLTAIQKNENIDIFLINDIYSLYK